VIAHLSVRVERRGPAFLALLAAGALGCGGGSARPDAPPVTQPCPIGDMSAAPELEIVHLDAQNAVINTQPMQTVPLMQPPQGGWIVLLGARARNIDGCRLTLTTALIDGCDGHIIQIDRRPTMLVEGSDGWGLSTATTFGNLPVCPQLTAKRDLNNVPYAMQVALEDDDGRTATAQLDLVPVCPANAPMCNCQCGRDYTIGSDCSAPPIPHGTCPAAATP
jgi:hypothetical protein